MFRGQWIIHSLGIKQLHMFGKDWGEKCIVFWVGLVHHRWDCVCGRCDMTLMPELPIPCRRGGQGRWQGQEGGWLGSFLIQCYHVQKEMCIQSTWTHIFRNHFFLTDMFVLRIYMERTTQCLWMLPEAQQFAIGSCQSKSLSTLKRLCVRMATRSKQTRRKPRTRHASLLKNGCNV